MDGEGIRKEALSMSELMRTVPGLKVVPVGDGRSYAIVNARDQNGCVSYYVDGTVFRSMAPGDIDDFVRPTEIAATLLRAFVS